MLENPFFKIFFSPFDFRHALPDVWAGFGSNLKMMFFAEVLVLIFALVLAIVRGLPGRGAATAALARDRLHATSSAARRSMLVAFVFGLGLPGAAGLHTASRTQSNLSSTASMALDARLLGLRRPRSTAPASSRCTRASAWRRARSASRYGQTLRYVVLPQAIRRVIPPLLNDFIGLQKDTAIIGVDRRRPRRSQQAQTYSNDVLQLHAATWSPRCSSSSSRSRWRASPTT